MNTTDKEIRKKISDYDSYTKSVLNEIFTKCICPFCKYYLFGCNGPSMIEQFNYDKERDIAVVINDEILKCFQFFKK